MVLVRQIHLLLQLRVLNDRDVNLLERRHLLLQLLFLLVQHLFGLFLGFVIDLVLKVKVLLTDNVIELDGVLALDIVLRMDGGEVLRRFLEGGSLGFDAIDVD